MELSKDSNNVTLVLETSVSSVAQQSVPILHLEQLVAKDLLDKVHVIRNEDVSL